MDRKRAAEEYIKPDPELKQVKKEDDGDHCDLSSIPRAHPTSAASFAPTFVKTVSSGDRKPRQQRIHRVARRPRTYVKTKPFARQFLLVRRGWNWVHAHLNKRDMVVELNIHYYRDIPWDLAGIETEIFERLHRAYMFVEPVEEPGFLIEHITNIKMMLGRLWFSAPLGKPNSGAVHLALDGKEVLFKISQDKSKDLFCSFAVRPLEGKNQIAIKSEDTCESPQPQTLNHRGIKIEEQKSD